MKNLKRWISVFLLLTLALTLVACDKEKSKAKDILSITHSEAYYDRDTLLKESEIILKGTVVSKDREFMTNPDGTREGVNNEQLAVYTVAIDELYKGTYDKGTISVMTSNGLGLSPDLILYGEDDVTVLAEPLIRFDLEVGKECIIALYYLNSGQADQEGYYVTGEDQGYFVADENGSYKSPKESVVYSPNPQTIAQEIAQATQS